MTTMKLLWSLIVASTATTLAALQQLPSIPYTWDALSYSDASDTTPERLGNCGTGPVDAQVTSDAICMGRDNSMCNVAFTRPGEYLDYRFRSDYDDYDIWVRVASNVANPEIRLELIADRLDYNPFPEGSPPESKTFSVVSNGWQAFHDIVWEKWFPMDAGEYTLRVHFPTGGVNLCSVALKYAADRFLLYAPGTYSALMYANDISVIEMSDEMHTGDCPQPSLYFGPWSPDAEITTDPICNEVQRMTLPACNIAWTEPGESLSYLFELDGEQDVVNLTFRVASAAAQKRIQVNGRTFPTPGKGWQSFETITWYNVPTSGRRLFTVTVDFPDGKVNLCSVGVEYVES